MKLPNSERAFIDIRKLRDYCLSPVHSRGKNKARVFASLRGLLSEDALSLRDFLLKVVVTHDVVLEEEDAFGQRYHIDAEWPGSGKIIRSSWIIRHEEDFPRLTSCYVL